MYGWERGTRGGGRGETIPALPCPLGQAVAPTLSVLGDCKFAMKDLLPLLKFKARPDWLAQIEQWRDEVPFKFQVGLPACSRAQQPPPASSTYMQVLAGTLAGGR